MHQTSMTLIAQLKDSHQDVAWERFVQLYTPLLQHWARKQGFQSGDIDDLVQEILMKLMHTITHYQQRSGHTFRAWLFAVMCNQGRDYRRRKSTRQLASAEGLSTAPEAENEDLTALDESEYRLLLTSRALELIRSDFSEATWKAFTMTTQEGKSAKETAECLTISTNAVFLAKNRVLSRLREELEGMLE